MRIGGLALVVMVTACGAPRAPEPRAPESAPPAPPVPERPEPAKASFRHHHSRLVAATGKPNHRVRDGLAVVGAPQVIEAKLAYGPTDKDLKDEDVEVEVETNGETKRLGVFRSSLDRANGPEDDGGRVRVVLDGASALGVGRHRFRFTVVGDRTSAEGWLVVVPKDQPAFVSDVDGTLTESEFAEVPALLDRRQPPAHSAAPQVLGALADRGYVPIYLTARPEWLVPRTREFLRMNRFPDGVLVTKRDKSGSIGAHAAVYKRGELDRIAKVVKVAWAFGNTPTDADAYAALVADPRRRVFYRYTDAAHGGRRIDAYDDLVAEVTQLPPAP